MKRINLLNDAFVLALISAFAAGSTPVFARIALEAFPPLTTISLRFFLACVVLLPIMYRLKEFNWQDLRKFWLVGLVGALNPIILFIALQFTQASVSPFIYAGVPAMTAIYTYVVTRRPLPQLQVWGIGVGLVGVMMIVLLPLIQRGTPIQALSGNVLIVLSAIAFFYYGILSKQYSERYGASPILLTFLFCISTLLISAPFAVGELLIRGLSQTPSTRHILSIVMMGVVGTSFSYVVYQHALKISSVVSASLFTLIQPVAVVLMAAILLGERITGPFVVGGILSVLGARLASRKS